MPWTRASAVDPEDACRTHHGVAWGRGCVDATIAPREANLERAREATLCLLTILAL